MENYYITHDNFKSFIEQMICHHEVIAPVAKENKFIFDKLISFDALRLDYDVTILPPKKEFFPPTQHLIRFDQFGFTGCIKVKEKILFGVHYYDIKGIDMSDQFFQSGKEDRNYMAHREATTLIGSSIQSLSPDAFWGTVGDDIEPQGHDGFLTLLECGYVFQVRNDKAACLLEYGKFTSATPSQIEQAQQVNQDIKHQCQKKLNYTSAEIAQKVRANYDNMDLWRELSDLCFSCGSCNTICPTCYCFDVQDNWNTDQTSGVRTRYWDSCLTEDFAKVSLGGGSTENFRDEKASRFRHRIMRKMAYLNESLGAPACTGCGRCVTACTIKIADPVKVVDSIMQEGK